MPQAATEKAEIERQQVAFLSRMTNVNAGATIAVALFSAILLWQFVPQIGWLCVWLAYSLLLSSVLFLRQRRIEGSGVGSPNSGRHALNHAFFWALSAGIGWGSLALFMPSLNPTQQLAVTIVICAMASGAASTLGPIPRVAAAFIITTLAPIIIFFLLQGGVTFFALAGMGAVFALTLLGVTRVIYGIFIESVFNRRQNAALLHQIKREREQAAADLSQSEARFRDLVENVGDMIQSVDAEGRYDFVNKAWLEMMGYGPEDIVDLSFVDTIHPDEHAHCRAIFERLAQHEQVGPVHTTFLTKDGRSIPVEGSVSALFEGEKLAGTRGIFRDVTLRRQSDQRAARNRAALQEAVARATVDLATANEDLQREIAERRQAEIVARESQAQLRLILDSTAEGIYGVDRDGRCVFANLACAQLLGFDDAVELLGADMHAIAHGARHGRGMNDHREEPDCKICAVHLSGSATRSSDDEFFTREDGGEFVVEYLANPILGNGKVDGAVVTFFDATRRHAVEEQLRQSQKMQAIGQLTGGIAHDFNNLLSVITGNIDLLTSCLNDIPSLSAKTRDEIERRAMAAGRAADRGAELTARLLSFSRREAHRPAILDVTDPIAHIADILRHTIGSEIQLEMQIEDAPWPVFADATDFENVLLNLAINARDAMPHGGNLTLKLDNYNLAVPFVGSRVWVPPGNYLRISLSDTGIGMSKDVLQRVFEPFFTTKEAGKGTGLGMAMVFGFVEQSKGYIGIESEVGKGTEITIYLPAVTEQSQHAAAGQYRTAAMDPGSGKVISNRAS